MLPVVHVVITGTINKENKGYTFKSGVSPPRPPRKSAKKRNHVGGARKIPTVFGNSPQKTAAGGVGMCILENQSSHVTVTSQTHALALVHTHPPL